MTVAPPASGPARASRRARRAGRPGSTPPPALGPIPSLTLPARGTGGSIRPSVRCALRCTVRAKLVVSKANARKLGLKKRTLATLSRTLTTTNEDPAAAARPGEGPGGAEARRA